MKYFYETLAAYFTGCLVAFPLLILFMFGINFIIAWIVMEIWNLVVVPAFASSMTFPLLGYWDTFWITIMLKLILSPISVNNKSK